MDLLELCACHHLTKQILSTKHSQMPHCQVFKVQQEPMGNLTSQSVLIFVDFSESLHKALKLQGPFSIGLTPKQSIGHIIFKPSVGPTGALHLTLTAWIWILLEAFGRGKCILSVVGRFKEDITVKT